MYLGLLLLFNNLKVIFVPIFIQKIDTMQSDQLNYIPILMQFVLAVGFVVTIIVSGKLGPKRSSEVKAKILNVVLNLLEMQNTIFGKVFPCSYIICFV
jgi:putative effector of murein hydrolase LrgA (UPF0299 family)